VHLKSLTVKGFKSFAEPTTLVFEPGVTCVVGPNGSGKSNVVDALSWVMGEQGAKSLRGGSMEDVIFAGTQSRGPLGRAEVSLTIDNTDGALPIDYSEVTISRTLFRNGASEYAINREPCRLLDVQELLSDTGLGREMHVIVGQGQLDGVLHATPDDRRRFIEEAAGILKHRRRKEKTVRKLESMQANLTRLQDLINEIRRQLKPLGRQAEVAREAQTIQATVRDAKARLLADDVHTLRGELADYQRSEGNTASERQVVKDELDRVSNEHETAEKTLAESPVERVRQRDNELRRVAERIASLHALATERVSLLGSAEQSSQPLSTVSEGDIVAADQAISEAEVEVARVEEELGKLAAVTARAKAALDAHDEQVRGAREAWLTWRATAQAKQEAVAVANSRVEAAEAELQRTQDALESAEARVAELESRVGELSGDSGGSADQALAEAEEALQQAWGSESALTTQLESGRAELHRIEREKDALAAKVQALTLALESETQHELGSRASGKGRVAELISITPGYETAIARALGALADALVVSSRADAYELSQEVSGKDGQLNLVVDEADASGEVLELEGLVPATSVVKGPDGVIRLLRTTFIASSLAEIKRYWVGRNDLPADVHIVTEAGELFSQTLVQAGSGQQRSSVELIAERDQAVADLERVSTEVERQSEAVRVLQVESEAATEAAKAQLAIVRQKESERADQNQALSAYTASVEAARAERERLHARLETAQADCDSARQAVESAELELNNLPEQPASDTDDDTRTALVDTVEAARAAEIDARVVVEQARSKLGYQRDVRQGLDIRMEQEKREREVEAARAHERIAVHERAVRVSALTPTLIQVANAALEESGRELAMLEAARLEADQSIQRLRSRESELRERLAQMTESVHSIEMHIYERNLHLTQLTERAQEELGLSIDVLLSEYGPDQPIPTEGEGEPGVFSREEQQKLLQKAQRQLEQLGRVNPLALEEFQALEKRHQFLAEQLEDVLASKKDLLAIIDDIDETMRDVFIEAFEDTKNAFDQVFPVLFPGGQGALSLTNPDDLLTTGVEVAVRPKGKKIERLSLLSGGERSLAAVALLMAIFIARPSPFYILDEVEAALDDANLGRLLDVMEHLREGSQLIIITHQKRTMEIADALYGVSMRDDGVSAVVGQRVKESAVSA